MFYFKAVSHSFLPHMRWSDCLCQRPDVTRFQSTLPPLFDGAQQTPLGGQSGATHSDPRHHGWITGYVRWIRNERASDGGKKQVQKKSLGCY